MFLILKKILSKTNNLINNLNFTDLKVYKFYLYLQESKTYKNSPLQTLVKP